MNYTMFVLFLACAVSSAAAKPGPKGSDGEIMRRIQVAIDEVNRETDATRKVANASKLAALVKQVASVAGTDDTVAQLTSLLNDRQDAVRYWAATALGYIGPKAASAVPALEKAYEEKKDSIQSKTSASAIRIALKRIKVKAQRSR